MASGLQPYVVGPATVCGTLRLASKVLYSKGTDQHGEWSEPFAVEWGDHPSYNNPNPNSNPNPNPNPNPTPIPNPNPKPNPNPSPNPTPNQVTAVTSGWAAR